jgi:tetratricopeptide (TPR) repeat protein
MAFILNDVALCYRLGGRLDQARESWREAGTLWRALNNLPMLADSLAGSAELAVWAGDYNLALTLSEEAFEISQSIANLWGQSHSKLAIGYIYWDRGQPDQAIAVMQECLRLGELANYVTPQAITRADLAAVYGGLGAVERGLEIARQALTIAKTHMPSFHLYALCKMAQLHLRQGQFTEAESAIEYGKELFNQEIAPRYWQLVILAEAELALRQGDYERALAATGDLPATLHQFGLRVYIPEALYLRGKILREMGEAEAAHRTLLEARAEAEALGSRRMLWQILGALSQLETDPAEARHLRQQAHEIVQSIAGNISNPELRVSFLNWVGAEKLLPLP